MTPLEDLGPRISPGEYPYKPISAGVPIDHQKLVHIINFNDLDSVRYVCKKYPIAALLTEPVLQNIGVVKPEPSFLAGLRALADEFGFILIFDEVKTGFRHAIGGYASIAKVMPDLAVFGKAVANGYPMAVIGGKQRDCRDRHHREGHDGREHLRGKHSGDRALVVDVEPLGFAERSGAKAGELFQSLHQRIHGMPGT